MRTLVDPSGRRHTYLRVSVTDRCNLACFYCMPRGGIRLRPREEILTFDEIARVAGALAPLGVSKVRLTGGEPLVRRGLPRLVELLSRVPGIDETALTTNGVLLEEFARPLRSAGLGRINVSLDTLRPERFAVITGSRDHQRVMAGIDAALAAGFSPLKLNVVVVRGRNDDEIVDFAEFVRSRPIEVRFIEFMPFRLNRWRREDVVTRGEMTAGLAERYRLVPLEDGSGGAGRGAAEGVKPGGATARGGPAKRFRIEGFAGRVGFIAPMSDPFCSACDRLRLTADGRILSCLFHDSGMNVKTVLRGGTGSGARGEDRSGGREGAGNGGKSAAGSEEAGAAFAAAGRGAGPSGEAAGIAALFSRALEGKPPGHGARGESVPESRRCMMEIGG